MSEHLLVGVEVVLRGADVFMISQFLHKADINTGIHEFGYKNVPSQMACPVNAELAINGGKKPTDT